jgi:hypothetical protein
MPMQHDAVFRPEIEVPDPQPRIDQRDQLLHLGLRTLRHLDVERAGDVQRFQPGHPGERYPVVGPLAAHQQRDLALVGALEWPRVRTRHVFRNIQRALAVQCSFITV